MHPTRAPHVRHLLVCAVLLLGGCSARAGTAPNAPARDATITLQRSSCYGTCPSYTVTARADGQVNFSGQLHVQTGKAEDRVDPARIANILAVVATVGFRSMQDSYASQDDGCATVMTDMPGVRITVADASGSKTVNFYYGCSGGTGAAVRPRIDQLAKAIDQQLGTARWVGKPKPATAAGVESADR